MFFPQAVHKQPNRQRDQCNCFLATNTNVVFDCHSQPLDMSYCRSFSIHSQVYGREAVTYLSDSIEAIFRAQELQESKTRVKSHCTFQNIGNKSWALCSPLPLISHPTMEITSPFPRLGVSIPKVRSSTFLHLGSNISLANLKSLSHALLCCCTRVLWNAGRYYKLLLHCGKPHGKNLCMKTNKQIKSSLNHIRSQGNVTTDSAN